MTDKQFQFSLTQRDAVRCTQANCLRYYVRNFLVVTVLLAVMQGIGIAYFDREVDLFLVYLSLALGVWYAFTYFVLLPRRAVAIYREQASMSETRTVTLSEQEIFVELPSGSWRSPWGNIIKWQEAAGFLFLYINRASPVPISCEAAGAENLHFIREQLATSGLPKPGKRRKKAK